MSMSELALGIAVAAVLAAIAGFFLGRQRERARSRGYERGFDALPYPAQLVADGGRVVYANAKFRQSFEAGDKPLPELLRQQVLGEPAGRELDRLAASGNAGKLDLAVATALGETSWREVSVQPLAGPPGQALWLCRETSADRRSDAALRPLVEALAKPHDGADRLEAQLAQTLRLQAVGQLAGGIAHDFNNLLTAMIGFCDLLLLRHRPGDQSFADVMQIRQNANRAASLVRQLLAYSRQQTLQPRVISLSEVLAELAHLLRRLIGGAIDLKLEHGRDIHPVMVDQGQVEQVVINLVVNARDAMPEGGTLTIRTANLTAAALIP